ncbi:hypothetical protein ACFSKJ_00080 [Tabrizicola soli]|uniref:hypothetical protein n=1 Tax=Tabrizicola soli TaxID=2185115 RepID=UPI003639E200
MLHRIDGDMAVVVGQAVAEDQMVRVQHREGSRHSLAVGARAGDPCLAARAFRAADRGAIGCT